MKANELRIGNYAKGLFGETVSLKAIYEDGTLGWQDGEGTTYGPMKPIKLNDGWLINLGFKYLEEHTCYNKNEHDVALYKSGVIEFIPFGNGDYPINIQYVHQLQNLYFALTGEEL